MYIFSIQVTLLYISKLLKAEKHAEQVLEA